MDQIVFKPPLGEIREVSKKYGSKEQKMHYTKLKCFIR